MKFEWNEVKAASNQVKHGISFKEAKSAFFDERALQFFDNTNSILDEDRFLLLGMSNASKLLLICHCERKAGKSFV
ncbi:BrnT family toxin [Glaciecola sp. SC05]|uniref:BrnT family toxin n=1 Tax=Glaciecola sp. SC05 TaxID=1987355 RepID=UPI003528610D